MVKAFFALITAILNAIAFISKRREAIKIERDKKKMDKALAERDTDTISSMFDELRKPDSSDIRGPDDQKPS